MTGKEFLAGLTIIIDSREQCPYTFPGHRTVVEGLPIADYGLLNCPDIFLERKSVDDLIGSLTSGRDRLEKVLQKGAQVPYFGLIIEASLSDLANGRYKSSMLPKSAVQTLLSWSVKYGTHIFFCDNREYAERVTLSLLLKYGRSIYQKYSALTKVK